MPRLRMIQNDLASQSLAAFNPFTCQSGPSERLSSAFRKLMISHWYRGRSQYTNSLIPLPPNKRMIQSDKPSLRSGLCRHSLIHRTTTHINSVMSVHILSKPNVSEKQSRTLEIVPSHQSPLLSKLMTLRPRANLVISRTTA
jgi:hypothetical protein